MLTTFDGMGKQSSHRWVFTHTQIETCIARSAPMKYEYTAHDMHRERGASFNAAIVNKQLTTEFHYGFLCSSPHFLPIFIMMKVNFNRHCD